ncbi:hypothetical protein ACR9WD_14760 [Glutamicibacter sp. PAEs-4]|uniref:hypothetical protein n=1 Tax=Glutamicibacter sp. PAEs-4 TaxID=3444114 RepID=UPI003EBDD9F7
MSLNNEEFENVRKDQDIDEPLDGRDSQPAEGSSDAPAQLDADDPLRGAEGILDQSDEDPLLLNPETTLVEPLDEERAVDDTQLDEPEEFEDLGLDAERSANLPDQREIPEEQ